jgi:hypothetical protein
MNTEQIYHSLDEEENRIQLEISNLENQMNSASAKLNGLKKQHKALQENRRQCKVQCHFCNANAFRPQLGELPEGWTNQEIPTHTSDHWNELTYINVQVCPKEHLEEIESNRVYHEEEYDED